MTFNPNLPPELTPTAEVLARDTQLAQQAQALVTQNGMGVKVQRESYNSVQFGADGRVISRVRNGVQQLTDEEQAVARAQSAAKAELDSMQAEIERLTKDRDELTSYNPDGSPNYRRGEVARKSLDGQIRSLQLGLINQKRLNERRWRNEAASSFNEINDLRALAAELEAQGKVTRARTW